MPSDTGGFETVHPSDLDSLVAIETHENRIVRRCKAEIDSVYWTFPILKGKLSIYSWEPFSTGGPKNYTLNDSVYRRFEESEITAILEQNPASRARLKQMQGYRLWTRALLAGGATLSILGALESRPLMWIGFGALAGSGTFFFMGRDATIKAAMVYNLN